MNTHRHITLLSHRYLNSCISCLKTKVVDDVSRALDTNINIDVCIQTMDKLMLVQHRNNAIAPNSNN